MEVLFMTECPAPKNKAFVSPCEVMKELKPGMNIFIGTGVSEPRALVKALLTTDMLQDLTIIQLLSFGDAISLDNLDRFRSQKYRLKTFFSGWVASKAIVDGRVDLIPSRFSEIPSLIKRRMLPIDVVFLQVSEPNEAGYMSLGVSVDVARHAISQASLVVGEINPGVPKTFGDSFIPISDFDFLVKAEEPPLYINRWQIDDVFDRVAANVASLIEDKSCIAFTFGPLFDALAVHLKKRCHLGIHTPIFTDAMMDLVKSGAVSNRYKKIFRGKSLTSFAMGSPELYRFLDLNPLVEFQAVDTVFNPIMIGQNPRFTPVFHARKVDLSGAVALHFGKGSITSGPGQVMDFFNGAEISRGGFTIFALPSRNLKGESNILLSAQGLPNFLNVPDSVNMVATDYGVAYLSGRSIRERAQAIIEIAHPDDREELIKQAKEAKILYQDQIFMKDSAHLYPSEIKAKHTFKNGIHVRFRAIKPSDEEEMRRLFYRFSDKSVYYRYFAPIKTMPHSRMQSYVNVDFRLTMAIVGIIDDRETERIIAEARYVRDEKGNFADVAFVVDEEYQGAGISTYMFEMLMRLAKERGIKGFTADVLPTNKGMMKVFDRCSPVVHTKLETDSYHLVMPFDPETDGG